MHLPRKPLQSQRETPSFTLTIGRATRSSRRPGYSAVARRFGTKLAIDISHCRCPFCQRLGFFSVAIAMGCRSLLLILCRGFIREKESRDSVACRYVIELTRLWILWLRKIYCESQKLWNRLLTDFLLSWHLYIICVHDLIWWYVFWE